MKPAPFAYATPSSIEEAVALLAGNDDAKVLAGGQSLVPLLNLRLARPELLVDLNGIPGLDSCDTVPAAGGTQAVRFGALVRQRQLTKQSLHPMVAEASQWIAHAAIRSRGTIGGSLAHADAAAELPTVAMALGATIDVIGPGGERAIGIDDFFHGLLQTALADDELLTSVTLPIPGRWGFAELARRQGDFALVLVAVAELESTWRVAVGGIEGTPRRPEKAEKLLAEPHELTAERIDHIAATAASEVVASDHLHATASYQRGMVAEMLRRALTEAVDR